MHCVGKNSPEHVIVIITVNWCFSSLPKLSICLDPVGAQEYLPKGIGAIPVWSPFRIASGGVPWIEAWYMMHKNTSLHLSSQSSGVFCAALVTALHDHRSSSWRKCCTKVSEHLNRASSNICDAETFKWPFITARAIVCEIGNPTTRLATKSFLILFTTSGTLAWDDNCHRWLLQCQEITDQYMGMSQCLFYCSLPF